MDSEAAREEEGEFSGLNGVEGTMVPVTVFDFSLLSAEVVLSSRGGGVLK